MSKRTEKGASSFTDTCLRIFFVHHSQFRLSNHTESSAQVHITGHRLDYAYPDIRTTPHRIYFLKVFHYVVMTFLIPITLFLI